MKNHIIFSTIFFTIYTTIYAMERLDQRSFRDELLCAQTINQQGLATKDIQLSILKIAYYLKVRHSNLHKLNFNILGEKALFDFLYFTKAQENIFLTINPSVDIRENCACIVISETDHPLYRTLPESIKKYPLYKVKEYDD